MIEKISWNDVKIFFQAKKITLASCICEFLLFLYVLCYKKWTEQLWVFNCNQAKQANWIYHFSTFSVETNKSKIFVSCSSVKKKKKKNGGSLQAKSIWRGRHSTNIAACGLKLILISETTILTSRWLNRSAVWNLVCPWEHKPEGTREKQRQSFSNLLATGRYHRSLTSSAAGCCRLPTWWFPHEWQEKLQGNVRAMWQMRLTFSKRISSLKPAVPKKHYQNLCSYT